MKVLDTSAIINAYPFRHGYTVQEVISEIRDPETRNVVHNLVAAMKLFISAPSEEACTEVRAAAKKTGDSLSKADVQVLALAHENKGIIVTDDYGIQNVAKKLGVEFLPVGQRGIHHNYVWKHYCTACRRYRGNYICRTCGHKTQKRVAFRRK